MNTSRLYGAGEGYHHLVLLFRTVRFVRKARKLGLLDKHCMERIMLGVTQVNGCRLCSYAHTRIALETGMEASQIANLLGGELGDIPPDQIRAVLFAQHYAETKGRPSQSSWEEVVHAYGEDGAKGILGATRIIMVGNIWGVVIGFLQDRIHRRIVDPQSSLGYELALTFCMLPFMPIAAIHALAATLAGAPLLRFSETRKRM